MKIFHQAQEIREAFGGPPPHAVVSLGNFDGLHRGHLQVLTRAVQRARKTGGSSWVVTFDPHPLKLLKPDQAPALMKTREQKLRILESWGLDAVWEIPFTRAFADLEAEAFVRDDLHGVLNVRELFLGEDFCFGRGRKGDVALLKRMGAELGFLVESAPEVTVDGEPVRSSHIREHLAEGRIERANLLLGRPYWVEGVTEKGKGRGAALGFPTANLALSNELIPRLGVYCVWVLLKDGVHAAVANLGYAPTLGALDKPLLEAHLLDYDGDLYGRTCKVAFLHFLREEKRFGHLDELVTQIRSDVGEARAYFAGLPAPPLHLWLP